MEKEDSMLLAAAEDKMDRCRSENYMTHTGFLDMRQKSLIHNALRGSCVFYGGYEDAERSIAVFLPDYYTEADIENETPLCILRAEAPKGGRPLTHRDYLGSLLGLGLERSVIGDIIVLENGADIIVLSSVAEFLQNTYSKAGRSELKTEIVPISQLRLGEVRTAEKSDTVASLRLDSLISSAFNLSRAKAQEAIRQGLVFVNGIQCEKTDAFCEEGDKLVLRGKGKAVLSELGGKTRKDRIFVKFKIYL